MPLRPPHRLERPPLVVDRYVDAETGLLVRSFNPRAMREVFREDVLPPRDRFWRIDEEVPVVRCWRGHAAAPRLRTYRATKG